MRGLVKELNVSKSCSLPSGSYSTHPLDASAKDLGATLHQDTGVAACGLDKGVPVLVWPKGTPGQLAAKAPMVGSEGAGDFEESAPEIFLESFRRLEALRFGETPLGQDLCGGTSKNFFCYFRDHSPVLPPWLLDDGNPATEADANVRARIEAIVQREHQALKTAGLKPGTSAYNTAMLPRLLKAMTQSRADGGLGLAYVYKKDGAHFRRDGVEAYAAGDGDCNSFSFLFYAMARRARLNPSFLRVAGERNAVSQKIDELFHVGVSVQLNPAKPAERTAVDPSRGLILNDKDNQWYAMSLLDMAASHLRNVAYHNLPAALTGAPTLAWRETRLRQAYALAPGNFEIAFDTAKFFLDFQKDKATALPFAEKAVAVNPSLQAIWKE